MKWRLNALLLTQSPETVWHSGIKDADRVNVLRLLLVNELVRALDDQYYDLKQLFTVAGIGIRRRA